MEEKKVNPEEVDASTISTGSMSTATEGAAEEVVPPKGRAAAILAFKAKYPDRFTEEGATDPEDEEMYTDYMDEHAGMKTKLGMLEEANGKYADREMKFVALIDQNPDLQELLATINEDDEFLQSIKERKARFAEKENNAQETVKNILAWQQEDGLNDDERIARVQWIVQLAENIDNDIITREIWDSAGKAINYDTDVDEVAKATELAVKNAGIEKKKTEMKQNADIFPDVNASSSAKNTPSTPVQKERPYRFTDDLEEIS